MPTAYTNKQKAMLASIKEQYTGDPLKGPLRVEITVKGEGRGDLDNIAGAFMDCATGLPKDEDGVLWKDDRVGIISELEIKWQKAKKADSVWHIKIYQLSPEGVASDIMTK